MYIAYIEQIDGLTIITGVDKKSIDQEATIKIINDLLLESDEMKALKDKSEKINSYIKSNATIIRNEIAIIEQVRKEKHIEIVNESDLSYQQKETLQKYQQSKDFNKAQIKELQKDLPQLNENLKIKKLQLINENAIYQETAYNQVDISENQYTDYKIKLISICQSSDKKYLIDDGNIIDDNRGKTVWSLTVRWDSRKIQFLTDVKSGTEIWENELTDEQKIEIAEQVEIDRVSGLTENEKITEKEIIISNLLREAAIMKSELEIQDDPDALQKSQDWYNAQVLLVEEKYS